MNKLDALLAPKSIALIGASQNPNKLNGRPLKFLQEKGYQGEIFPVNPNCEMIAGLTCYPTVAAIGRPVDLAVVMVPAIAVLNIMRELVASGVRAAIVFSSGFSETGAEGAQRENSLRAFVQETGLVLCGPNCLGLINSFDAVMATFSQFANGATPSGPVGFVTQSGAFGTAIAALARTSGLGLGYFVNTGNEAGVSFSDVMQSVLCDTRIRVGAGYIEGIRHGDRFVELARHAMEVDKPLVITKVGRTGAGARAAISHTGSLAGEDAIFQGVCDQYGVVRARDEEHMLDVVKGFTSKYRCAGSRVGLVTQSGGAGVLMADKASELGLDIASLSPETITHLRSVVPAFGALSNPVDVTAQFIAQPAILRDSIVAVMDDPGVDLGVVWFQLMHEFVPMIEKVFEEVCERLDKPLLVCWVAGPEAGIERLRRLGLPVFRSAGAAMDAASALVRYGVLRAAFTSCSKRVDAPSGGEVPLGGLQPTLKAYALLQSWGVALVRTVFCRDEDEAVRAADELGYPVVLKVESLDIPHKSDIGGVVVGVSDEEAMRSAFQRMMASVRKHRPEAGIEGVVVQAMNRAPAIELVVGLKNDPVFGMVVMAGMGGIALEVTRDVVFRKAPVTEKQALAMLSSLRGAAMFGEVRGRPPIDLAAAAQFVARVSQIGAVNEHDIVELDINPLLVGPKGAEAVDWLLHTRELHSQTSHQ